MGELYDNEKVKDFNIEAFCALQMQRDDEEITRYLGASRFKLGMAKQYNSAVKNRIDAARLAWQQTEVNRNK
jgi:hypothetical protein